jgi:hypothetical protein
MITQPLSKTFNPNLRTPAAFRKIGTTGKRSQRIIGAKGTRTLLSDFTGTEQCGESKQIGLVWCVDYI